MNHVPVVGIGASAGGLEALQAVLAPITAPPPYALVIIQHLAPDYASMTADILARHSKWPVRRVAQDTRLEQGVAYVIEPNSSLRLEHGMLCVGSRDAALPHRPIDIFFESLAQSHGSSTVAILLSGTGSDGTEGCQAIKERGGFVIAQDPQTARFDGMPMSVISAGINDLILPPAEILPRAAAILSGTRLAEEEDGLAPILELLSSYEQVDLRRYREPTLRRRVQRRLALSSAKDLDDYLEILKGDEHERNVLVADLFIGVTRFFRDREAYEVLAPHLEKNVASGSDPIRIWVCGCSTGEEAYSIAMLVDALLQKTGSRRPFQVFATDISERAIRTASRGEYPLESIREVPADMLQGRFHQQRDGSFTVDELLRSQVVFSRHDVLNDPPFSRIDLVVCRNVSIYFRKEAQEQLLSTFSFALNPGGLLWLGPSEGLAEGTDPFVVEDGRWRIYRNTGLRKPWVSQLDVPQRPPQPIRRTSSDAATTDRTNWKRLYEDVTTGFVPSHIVLTPADQMVYKQGELANQLITFPDGLVSMNISHLLPEELRPVVSQLLDASRTHGSSKKIKLELTGWDFPVTVFARQSEERTVLYLDRGDSKVRGTDDVAPVLSIVDLEQGLQRRIDELEHDLRTAHAMVQTTVEQLEASNEELQATNEEMMAANEELQSVNEELQSVNEELHTVNAEHRQKILELGELNQDLDTLLATVEHGVLFVETDLTVRRFNPRAQSFVALARQDEGRSLEDFRHELVDFDLIARCRTCLEQKTSEEHVVRARPNKSVLLRLAPLNGRANVHGLVISFTDVTAFEKLRESHGAFLAALDNVDLPLALLNRQGEIQYSNRALASLTARDHRFMVGTDASHLVQEQHRELWNDAMRTALSGQIWEGYVSVLRADGLEASEVVRLSPTTDHTGAVRGLVRMSLVKVQQGIASRKGAAPFFLSQGAMSADASAGVRLLCERLRHEGAERERALTFVHAEDRDALRLELSRADALAKETEGSEQPLSSCFRANLGRGPNLQITASISHRSGAVQIQPTRITWELDDGDTK